MTGTTAAARNQGGAAVTPFRVGFYLSTSPSMTTSTVYTGSACTGPSGLAAASTFNCNIAVNMPAGLTPGTWYLLAMADDQIRSMNRTRTTIFVYLMAAQSPWEHQ